MTAVSFSHIGITVPDLEKAVEFYRDAFGFYVIMGPTEVRQDDSAIGVMCDDVFGPDFGGANVFTNVRTGWTDQCPNAGKLVTQLVFDLKMENEVMGKILDDGMEGEKAAESWLKANPAVLDKWLAGVTTFDGKPGLAAVKASLGL